MIQENIISELTVPLISRLEKSKQLEFHDDQPSLRCCKLRSIASLSRTLTDPFQRCQSQQTLSTIQTRPRHSTKSIKQKDSTISIYL